MQVNPIGYHLKLSPIFHNYPYNFSKNPILPIYQITKHNSFSKNHCFARLTTPLYALLAHFDLSRIILILSPHASPDMPVASLPLSQIVECS